MKKSIVILITGLLFTILAHGVFAAETVKESAYDRVMRTGVLRCGYFSWAPSFIKDANTGALSGIFHDSMEAIGQALSLKVEWTEEVALGEFPAALKSGRIDAMCTGTFAASARARVVDFIAPLYYLPIHAYARKDDNRFDGFTTETFDKPAYTVAILEGGVTSTLHHQYLSETKLYELPQFTSPSELFVSLAQKKADFVLYDLFTFEDYNARNPRKLKRVTQDPIKVFPLAISVDKNQGALREMLNTATTDAQLSGTIEKIIKRYEGAHPHILIRPALPYKM